jgi:hypothetical protein
VTSTQIRATSCRATPTLRETFHKPGMAERARGVLPRHKHNASHPRARVAGGRSLSHTQTQQHLTPTFFSKAPWSCLITAGRIPRSTCRASLHQDTVPWLPWPLLLQINGAWLKALAPDGPKGSHSNGSAHGCHLAPWLPGLAGSSRYHRPKSCLPCRSYELVRALPSFPQSCSVCSPWPMGSANGCR